MMTGSYQFRRPRRGALALVMLAHVGALLWMQAARTVRLNHPVEQWIDLQPVPARPERVTAPAAPPVAARKPARATVQAAPVPRPPLQQALPADPPRPAAVPASAVATPAPPPVTATAASSPPDLASRALAAARAADRAERGGKTPALTAQATPQRKLAAAIDAATAGPRHLWEAPRITPLKDVNGYGRRIYKVETGLGTYCIVDESNHALDGRDVFRGGSTQKTVSCPIEF